MRSFATFREVSRLFAKFRVASRSYFSVFAKLREDLSEDFRENLNTVSRKLAKLRERLKFSRSKILDFAKFHDIFREKFNIFREKKEYFAKIIVLSRKNMSFSR